MKSFTYMLLAFLLCTNLYSQNKKEILLTVGNKPVTAKEFKRVYKKNLDLVKDESQKTVDGYLDLFIDYQLKIAEAYDQDLHLQPSYVTEFDKYEEQLSRNYIYDEKVTGDLVREAYERSLEEVEVSHILIMADVNASPADTLKAYKKITEIRDKALAGEDFTELAKTYSEEPGAEERGGYLGTFSVFQMVYPFESMAYNTPVGEISEIVRTQFGYHILKVHKRREKAPEITVSHIMISDKQDDSQTIKPSTRIQDIYRLLQQGESFEELAKQYSDDKNSGAKGGKLNRFGRGQLRSKIFETFAYRLKNPGDLSKPFQSEFGWHIIRLDEIHQPKSFEQQQFILEKRVKEGNRSKVVTNAINQKIKEKYGFEEGEPLLPYFADYLPEEVLQRKFSYDSVPPAANKTVFTIGDRNYTFEEFARYIESRQRLMPYYKDKEALVNAMYTDFENDRLREYYKQRLEEENETYAATISEYRNGLLIFDLMNANIWMKAKTDSLGLEAYFETIRDQYRWEERVDALIVSTREESYVSEAVELLRQGKTAVEIREALNESKVTNVIVTEGKFEAGDKEIPDGLPFEKGISEVYNIEGSFVVVKVKDVIPPQPRTLEEVRGKVLNSYQNHLEEEWMKSLREKYKVKVNKKVLKRIKKEFET